MPGRGERGRSATASIERAGGSDRRTKQLAANIVALQTRERAAFNALVRKLG